MRGGHFALGLNPAKTGAHTPPRGADEHEQALLDLLASGISDGAVLLEQSNLDAALFGQTLTMLELRGHIRPLGGNHWGLA